MEPYIAQLMRRRKDTGDIVVCAEVACVEATGASYERLWQWIGGREGTPHPHPLCLYWIQNRTLPALFVTEERHLVRGEN